MNLLLDLQILGWLLVGLGGLQVVPGAVALGYGEPVLPYAGSAAVALAFGLPLALSTRSSDDRRLRARDGFLVVSGAWLLASAFGALPYGLTGTLGPADALFEAASGFTTTGSTVLTDIEGAPHGLLLWRSLTQWLGGMGIIVFTIAVLPLLGIGGMQLFKAEMSGPMADKLTPRVADTAKRLWTVYALLTLLALLAYLGTGMGAFDAACHALTTLATGGFSTRTESLAAFPPAAQWAAVLFMFLGGVNFVLHYQVLARLGRWLGSPAAPRVAIRPVLRNAEFRLYVALVVAFAAAFAWILSGEAGLRDEPLWRHASFQAVSLLTTTGYATDDYELWPLLAQLLVFPLLVLGGMAGSTAGGLKSLRALLGLRALGATLERVIRPHGVSPVRYEGRPVPDEVVSGIGVFVLAYILVAFVGALAVGSAGYDLVTALSAALTAVSNVGPALAEVGPTDHFGHFPGYVKLVLAGCMIAGRLEIFTLIALLLPAFWRR